MRITRVFSSGRRWTIPVTPHILHAVVTGSAPRGKHPPTAASALLAKRLIRVRGPVQRREPSRPYGALQACGDHEAGVDWDLDAEVAARRIVDVLAIAHMVRISMAEIRHDHGPRRQPRLEPVKHLEVQVI